MDVKYDVRSAEEMLSVFEMINSGRKVEREDIERVLDLQSYKFFFEYHLDPVWHEVDPLFSRELYVDMILSLQDHRDMNKGSMRLKEMLKRYRNGLNKVEMLRENLDKIRTLDVERGAKRAMTCLPEDTDVGLTIYLLIDGVNTGYAHYGKWCGVGLDLLGFTSINIKSAELEGYLGHELHHIGFLYWSKKNLGRTYEGMGNGHVDLALFAWCDMIMEGLATHYFGHFEEGELDRYASPDDLCYLNDFLYKGVNKEKSVKELKREEKL